jgi:hypothetical protein
LWHELETIALWIIDVIRFDSSHFLSSQQTLICSSIAALVDSVESDNGGDPSDSDALNTAAVKLLPVMFKIVSASHPSPPKDKKSSGKDDATMDLDDKPASNDTDGQQVQSITDAVASLARLAPKPFLHGLFKKLMHRLLEEVQSENGDSEKICSLLSLARALVASEVLDEESVAFLYRAIKPLIRNDEHGQRVQKRSYKVLAEICERHHSFVSEQDRLKELTDLLTGTIVTSQVAARHMRLKCMNIIVDGFKETGPADTVRFVSRHLCFLFYRNSHVYYLFTECDLQCSCRGAHVPERLKRKDERSCLPAFKFNGLARWYRKTPSDCHCSFRCRNATHEIGVRHGVVENRFRVRMGK